MTLLLASALGDGDVAWVSSTTAPLDIMTPVRIDKLDGDHAIVSPAQLVLVVDERGRITPVTPRVFGPERMKLALDDLERDPPTKTSLRLRAVAEQDVAKKKALLARALALDPFDATLAEESGATPTIPEARVVRADLVYGCRGDLARASLIEGDAALTSPERDACALRVDTRPPCAAEIDDSGLTDDDVAALRAAADEQHAYAKAAHAKRRARLAGFAAFGPGLRVVVEGGGALWVTSSLLLLEGCDCEGATARSVGDDARRIVLPKLSRPAVVYVKVPRYLGALHRIGTKQAPGAFGAVTYQSAFHAEPDDERPGLEVFSAPETCGCDC